MINTLLLEEAATENSFVKWFKDLWNSIVYFVTNGKFEDTNNTGSSLAGRIIIAVIIFVAFFYINKFIIWVLKKSFGLKKGQDKTVRTAKSFIISIIKAVLAICLVVICLSILGFDISGLSTIISSAIVAIGLSLQDIIANFASGIIIISSKKHLVGDFIDVSGTSGTIKDVGLLATELVTPDNIIIYVPNSTMTSSNVTNYNTMKFRRINLTVSTSYNSNVDQVKKIIKGVVDQRQGVIKEMPVTVVLGKLSDSSVDYYVRCYVPTSVYWDVYFALNEEIYKEFTARNVAIPYNQLDVNLRKADPMNSKINMAGVKEVTPVDSSLIKSPMVSRYEDEDVKEIDQLIDKAKKAVKKNPSAKKKTKSKSTSKPAEKK